MSERPLECGECKKPVKVCYTEIIGDLIVRTSMCQDCPELQKRLHGIPPVMVESLQQAGLCCGNCQTTLDAIRQGSLLGCSECYEVFGDILAQEIISLSKLKVLPVKKNSFIHKGRAPGESKKITPAFKLVALNDALKETLKREDYGQAALLRDQIKELMENNLDEQKQ